MQVDPTTLLQSVITAKAQSFLTEGLGEPSDVGEPEDDESYMPAGFDDEGMGFQPLPVGESFDDYDDEDDDLEDILMLAAGEPGLTSLNVGDPNAVGGVISDWAKRRGATRRYRRNMRKNQRRDRQQARNGGASPSENAQVVNSLAPKVYKNTKENAHQQTAIQKLHKRLKKVESTTVKAGLQKAMLMAAQSLPGDRAYSILRSDAVQGFFEGFKKASASWGTEVFSPAKDDLTLTAVAALVDNTAPNIELKLNAIIARQDAIVSYINGTKDDVCKIAEGLQAVDLEALSVGVLSATEANTIIDLATFAPSQIEDRNPALLEAGLRHFVGKVSKDGGSSFGIDLKVGS